MSGYHCLNCGEKLKGINAYEWTDKYECTKCGAEWYRIKRLIVEWVESPKEVVNNV